MSCAGFDVVARDVGTRARAGVIHTPHGPVATPAFAPVGTHGVVKAVSPLDLRALGVSVVMCNAYHLAMRPGVDTVVALGGLHRLSGWDGPLMTDSGGYQIFSLAASHVVDRDGVSFRSHIDGSAHRLTPEDLVAIEEHLGADMIMPLDVCTGYPVTHEQAEREMRITRDWAERSLAAHRRDDQLLYGIVQGATYADLRETSARATAEIGFPAFAIGGVSVGEPKAALLGAIEHSVPYLPDGAPRHLLGVGQPEDILGAIGRGIDTFDCVAPTRWARNGAAITMRGRVNLRNAVFAHDADPIEPACPCLACRRFSRGAIRHLLKSGEILGVHLLTLHNLQFVIDLTARLRRAIVDGRFAEVQRVLLDAYADGRHAPVPSGTPAPAGARA